MSACIHCHEELQSERADGLLVTARTCDWWCPSNPSNGGDAAPHEAPRNRMKSPSINFPLSEEEAAQAIIHQTRKLLLDPGGDFNLAHHYAIDSGLGTTRTQQQADWLNQQQSILAAILEDVLDNIDLSAKDN